jgi:hypothetical protein
MSLTSDIFPEGLKKAKKSRYHPRLQKVKKVAKKAGKNVLDFGYHEVYGKPRTKKKELANRKQNRKATHRILKGMKKKILW